MMTLTNAERLELVRNSQIEYSSKLDNENLMLCPTVCGLKFCGWYLTSVECINAFQEFIETWDGELAKDQEGVIK